MYNWVERRKWGLEVVLFEWLNFMTEFSMVKVRGSSPLPSELMFFGNNLESSLNSPLRASFTSLAGSSCTESSATLVGCLDPMAPF